MFETFDLSTYWSHLERQAVLDWGISILVFLVVAVGLRMLQRGLVSRIRKLPVSSRKKDIQGLIVSLIADTKRLLLFSISLFVAAGFVQLPVRVESGISAVLIFSLFFQIGIWGNEIITFWIQSALRQRAQGDAAGATAYGVIAVFLRMVVWSLVVLLALENFGVDVTALVAGLGVGSVAIALAVQNILGDIFCSVSIVLDKPFEVGDFIVVDAFSGNVERIGIKSTRIRSLQGEQIVISNANLIASRIQNFKRMQERRVLFGIGVTYQTPTDKVRKIPLIIRNIIEQTNLTRFDRAHFKAFGDSALEFEVVYYVLSSEYNAYMDTQQAINVAILEQLSAEGIEFAYPTQTLFLEATNSGAEKSAMNVSGA